MRRYLDLLSGAFMVRQLQPWHENLGKRQVKSPKVYVRDSGLLHQLLGIRTASSAALASQVRGVVGGLCHRGDVEGRRARRGLLLGDPHGGRAGPARIKDGRRLGVEVKRADAPRVTPSMRAALGDLRLEQLVVLYPGDVSYPLGDRVTVRPLESVVEGLAGLFPRRRR